MNTAIRSSSTKLNKPESLGNITEITMSTRNELPPSLLLVPFLKLASMSHHDRWMIFINPPSQLDKHTLQKMGVDPTCVLVLHSNSDDALRLTERALANGNGHTIVSWVNVTRYRISDLERAAHKGNSQGLIIRQRA
jgi:cell division inhibitor SulA